MERLLTRPPGGFHWVLLAVVVAVIVQMTVPDDDLTRVVTVSLQALILLLALNAAGVSRRVIRIGAAAAAVVVLAAGFLLLGPPEIGVGGPRLLTLAVALLCPVVIVFGLLRDLRTGRGLVSAQAVFAGLCFYLLLGISFAFLYATIEGVGGDPFFSEVGKGSPNDFMYFSYATLTTTGYGDLTAAAGLGRALSVTQALTGQIYLVTVIALLVANLGRQSLLSGRERS